MRERAKTRRVGVLLAVIVGVLGVAAGASAGVQHQTLAAEVHVTFTDQQLVVSPGKLQSKLASFDVAFDIVNQGKKAHVFSIKGPGLSGGTVLSGTRQQRVAPGSHATLRVTLVTGAYKLTDAVGLRGSAVRWLVISSAASGTGTAPGSSPRPANPNFTPGETSTNSWMDCI